MGAIFTFMLCSSPNNSLEELYLLFYNFAK